MKRNPVLYKTLVVGVIVLFIGIGVQPAFAIVEPENIDANYYDVNVEFCGLGKNHKVQLTKQQFEELELLFETIRGQLNTTESKEETIQIYNNAIERVDSLGLLGDYSVKQVQELVTGRFQKPIFNILINRLFDKINYDNNTNTFCYFYSSGVVYSVPVHVSELLAFYLYLQDPFNALALLFAGFKVLLSMVIPFTFGSLIIIGAYDIPAEGHITTYGLNGKKEWNGEFYGQIVDPLGSKELFGVIGFTGISIFLWREPIEHMYLGFTPFVNIGYQPPN